MNTKPLTQQVFTLYNPQGVRLGQTASNAEAMGYIDSHFGTTLRSTIQNADVPLDPLPTLQGTPKPERKEMLLN